MFVIYIIQKKIHIKKIIPPFSAPFPKKKMANTKTPALNCLEASSAVIPTLTCNNNMGKMSEISVFSLVSNTNVYIAKNMLIHIQKHKITYLYVFIYMESTFKKKQHTHRHNTTQSAICDGHGFCLPLFPLFPLIPSLLSLLPSLVQLSRPHLSRPLLLLLSPVPSPVSSPVPSLLPSS